MGDVTSSTGRSQDIVAVDWIAHGIGGFSAQHLQSAPTSALAEASLLVGRFFHGAFCCQKRDMRWQKVHWTATSMLILHSKKRRFDLPDIMLPPCTSLICFVFAVAECVSLMLSYRSACFQTENWKKRLVWSFSHHLLSSTCWEHPFFQLMFFQLGLRSQVLQYYGVIAMRSAALVGFSINYSNEVHGHSWSIGGGARVGV